MPEADYSEFKDGPGDNLLAQISATALEQKEAEAKVAKLEEELQVAKDTLRDISERRLPELMDSAEMTSFTLSDGTKIEVNEKIRAGIPPKTQGQAFMWLKEHGHDALIKNQITVDFDREQEDIAEKFAENLREKWDDVRFKQKKTVHASTLASFIKEQLSEGIDIPLDIFGAFRQRFSKITT